MRAILIYVTGTSTCHQKSKSPKSPTVILVGVKSFLQTSAAAVVQQQQPATTEERDSGNAVSPRATATNNHTERHQPRFPSSSSRPPRLTVAYFAGSGMDVEHPRSSGISSSSGVRAVSLLSGRDTRSLLRPSPCRPFPYLPVQHKLKIVLAALR